LQVSQLKDKLYALENTITTTRVERLNSSTQSPTQPFQAKDKKLPTSGLPPAMPSQNYGISGIWSKVILVTFLA
jgi:hypothetical protein